MPSRRRKRIYLAGPEVFLPDAADVGQAKAAAAAEAGFEGVFPLDGQLDLSGLGAAAKARAIALANEGLMRSCDLLVANLTPFRGVSMDAGTAYEVGFMRALGRPVLGYTNTPGDYRARAEAFRGRGIPPGDSDRPGLEIEDFDMAENLMIAVAVLESGGSVVTHPGDGDMHELAAFRRCLAEARRIFPA
jgi:nucleoside 2-deoxyribosyltransferase